MTNDDQAGVTAPLTQLNGVSIEQFLAQYWQQQPLLIRNAFPHFRSPVQADEIAGFAVDDDVDARLVIQEPMRQQWRVIHSPVPPQVFEQLPEREWTLLVQHANLLDPGINALLQPFRFIPNWRLDDIMVSYAVDGGGVGPHFDYYDVFLLQGQGKRRWRIGQQCDVQSPLIPDQPMRILAQFEQSDEFILHPGDMLYVPPYWAHWGTAIGESITYSIGFRAPSHADILLDASQELALDLSEDDRYRDPRMHLQSYPGEIRAEVVSEMIAIFRDLTAKSQVFVDWLGSYATRNDHYQAAAPSQLQSDGIFSLDPFARSVFIRTGDGHSVEAQLYVNGNRFLCSLAMATAITEYRQLHVNQLSDSDKKIASQLAALGTLKINI